MSNVIEELLKSIRASVIVHSRAFSHRKVAEDVKRVVGGVLASYNDVIDTFNSRVIVISTVDYIDIALSSRFIVPAGECIYYGVVEGIPVLTPLSRSVISNCRVVVPSRYVMNVLTSIGINVDDVVPHAVSLSEPINSEVADLKKRVKRCRKVVGWIGANQVRKGLDIVFRVAGIADDVCFLVVTGDGEIRLNNIPRNVIVVKKVYGLRSVSSLFKVIDVFLSTSRNEGFGLPVFEALAFGKPVVAPSIPVYTEFSFLRDFLYRVHGPRHVMYKGYMWMEYFEPVIDSLVDKLYEMLSYSVDKSLSKEVLNTLSLENYKRLI